MIKNTALGQCASVLKGSRNAFKRNLRFLFSKLFVSRSLFIFSWWFSTYLHLLMVSFLVLTSRTLSFFHFVQIQIEIKLEGIRGRKNIFVLTPQYSHIGRNLHCKQVCICNSYPVKHPESGRSVHGSHMVFSSCHGNYLFSLGN